MASSDRPPGMIPALAQDVPGEPVTMGTKIVEKSAKVLQSLTPVKQFQQHVCTFALFSHDMSRQIETHHYVERLNEDFMQCAVFDSDQSDARLIGLEYIVSDRLFSTLAEEEQKLWHSHLYETRSGLWDSPGVSETVQQQELKKFAKTYGKFWCTWQYDRGDRIPLGVPALMMSPREEKPGQIRPDLIRKRDEKYKISSNTLADSRTDIESPQGIHPLADYWKKSGRGFVVEVKEVDMALPAGSPPKLLQ